MPSIKDTTLMRLIKDMQEVRAALRHVTTNLPLYDVANENTPASISTDQDDYVPGNYDVLRINATADVSITGISGGKKGRFLEIINVGTGRISFPDEDAGSAAANRIATPYDQTVTLLPNARARFYYDDTQLRWTVADLPNIQGEFGKYAVLAHSSAPYIQTVPDLTYTKFQPDTVVTDEWGYWDAANYKFVIPSGERGLYSITLNFIISAVTGGTDYYFLVYPIINAVAGSPPAGVYLNYFRLDGNNYNAYAGTVNLVYYKIMEPGDDLTIYFYHDLAADARIAILSTVSPVMTFAKVG